MDAARVAPPRLWTYLESTTGRTAAIVAGSLLAAVIAYVADNAGLWWMTLPIGLALGLALGRWIALFCAALVGLLAWGGALLTIAQDGSISRIAEVTGGLAGYGPHAGTLIICATLVVGVLLVVLGAWLGVALRALVRAFTAVPLTSTAGLADVTDSPSGTAAEAVGEPNPTRTSLTSPARTPNRPAVAGAGAKEIRHA